jgi:DNA-binding transcriptional MerR regulator
MEIKDIRLFMEWCAEGPSTYPKRKAMFEERKAHMESEIADMNRALDMLKFKCWYYEEAMQDGGEDRPKALIPDDLPDSVRKAYENAHAR